MVVVRYGRVEPKVPGLSPTQYLIFFSFLLSFFSPFFVSLFSTNKYINIYLNNCYLIKCNKQQEKYRFSREKIVHRILNIWINNLNFYHFLQFTVGKPELITIWSFSKQRSHDFFYRLRVIITFQHVNWTHSMSFSILLSLTQADDVSVNRMYRSITIFRYPSMEDCKIFSTWTVAASADKPLSALVAALLRSSHTLTQSLSHWSRFSKRSIFTYFESPYGIWQDD